VWMYSTFIDSRPATPDRFNVEPVTIPFLRRLGSLGSVHGAIKEL
jgi:hypothetical protein